MMKKCFILLAAIVTAFAVSASESSQIINTLIEYRLTIFAFDFEKALKYCTDDYVEYAPDGSRKTAENLRQMMLTYRMMENSDDLEVVLACAMRLQGAVMSEAQRQQIRAIKGTPKGAQALAAVKQQLNAIKNQMSSMREALIKMMTIRDVKISGNQATAIQEVTEPGSGKKYITHYKLRKVNRQWLICELRQEDPA
ncbi:MAG: hypothetical protein IKC94_03775 [Lentisphaeria bacterium]|nr:hypothetical protein [Lentisphaeria bacterium]